jgi:predicted metal-dependent hydrolase
MSLLPRYTHIVNHKLKHTYLSFDGEGNLIIKSPKVSQSYIEKLLLKKANWINRSRKKLLNKKGKALDFSKESELLFMGKLYPLTFQKQTKKRTSLAFDGNAFILHYHLYDEAVFQKRIDYFYKEKAKNHLPPLVEEWASQMSLTPNRISFRKTKRQWGSCSAKNDLSFNTMIIKLPQPLIEYIVVHELAHIRHKHHQKSFWAEVAHYLSHYKSLVKELKIYTTH